MPGISGTADPADLRWLVAKSVTTQRGSSARRHQPQVRAATALDVLGQGRGHRHEIYHDDAVLEFPQSQERFEGVDNFREWQRIFPAELNVKLGRINHRDDLVVTEYAISYDGGPWMFCVSIMEFRGDKVAHEHIYIMEGWDAPDWRAPWRASTPSCDVVDE